MAGDACKLKSIQENHSGWCFRSIIFLETWRGLCNFSFWKWQSSSICFFRITHFLVLCHVIVYLQALRKHPLLCHLVRASWLLRVTCDFSPQKLKSLWWRAHFREGRSHRNIFTLPWQPVIWKYHFFFFLVGQFQNLTRKCDVLFEQDNLLKWCYK